MTYVHIKYGNKQLRKVGKNHRVKEGWEILPLKSVKWR